MVEIGSVIQATVERVERYGLFLRFGKQPVFVHLPEVSWVDIGDLETRFHIGEVVSVLVIRYNYPERIIVGSIRRLHPEENPYRKLSRLEPGTVLRGKVGSVIGDEIRIDLPEYVFGYLPKTHRARALKRGQTVETVIDSLNVDEARLWLRLAEKSVKSRKKPKTRKKVSV